MSSKKVVVDTILHRRYVETVNGKLVSQSKQGYADGSDQFSRFVATQHFVSVPNRPDNWDERHSGVDVVRTSDGEVLKLLSDGMQSTPKPGWVIMLLDGNHEQGFRWTLYGIPSKDKANLSKDNYQINC